MVLLNKTRLITMRAKHVVVAVLIAVAVHKGLVVKVYLILIKAITVVELASQPCLDPAFTLPNPLLDLGMNLS